MEVLFIIKITALRIFFTLNIAYTAGQRHRAYMDPKQFSVCYISENTHFFLNLEVAFLQLKVWSLWQY